MSLTLGEQLWLKKAEGEEKTGLNVNMKAAGLQESEKASWCLCEECWDVARLTPLTAQSIIFNYSSVTP